MTAPLDFSQNHENEMVSPLSKPQANEEMIRMATAHGAVRSFSQKEIAVFANHLNHCFTKDAAVQYLMPINPNNLDLLTKLADGVLFSRFINLIQPDTIDMNRVNINPNGHLNQYHIIENQNVNLEAAKQMGMQIHNVSAEDLRDAEHNPILVLGLMWQLVKLQFLSKVTMTADPKLITMLQSNDNSLTSNQIQSLDAEALLIEWVNYHLQQQQSLRRIKHFGSDLQDGEVYTILFASIGSDKGCTLEPMEWDIPKRAQQALMSATKMGVQPFLTLDHILNGHDKFNMAFIAQLFNVCHAHHSPDVEEVPEFEEHDVRDHPLWDLASEPGSMFAIMEDVPDVESAQIVESQPVPPPETMEEMKPVVERCESVPLTMFDVWKQQRQEELHEKSQSERDEIQKLRIKGQEDLEAFHEERKRRIDGQRAALREAEAIKKEEMEALLLRGAYWQQVDKMVDLKGDNPKTSRMRDLMIILKNDEEKVSMRENVFN